MTRSSSKLRIVFEKDAEDDDRPSLVSVQRVDGVIEVAKEGCLTDAEWFENDWDNGGALILDGLVDSDSFGSFRKLVVVGHMWSSHSNTPEGEDWDSGFTVDELIESVKELATE